MFMPITLFVLFDLRGEITEKAAVSSEFWTKSNSNYFIEYFIQCTVNSNFTSSENSDIIVLLIH